MINKEARASRYTSRNAIIIGISLIILLVQSILLITPQQWLFAAAGENHLDRLMAIGNEPEQTSNCDASSYQVQPGDTIKDVAGRAGATSQQVVDCNNLTSDVVYAGQVLSLPGEVNNNRGTTPQSRYSRTYRPTPSAPNGYQRPNNGSLYNSQQRARPQRRRP